MSLNADVNSFVKIINGALCQQYRDSRALAVLPKREKAVLPREPIRTMREIKKRAVIDALTEASGNVSRACKLLGISRATLYRSMKGTNETL